MEGIKGKTTAAKGDDNSGGVLKKERHIVVWSREEDDVLREQIGLLGTDSWTSIASRFKDKTPRQCRRRWYTYLNSDFKKGGWTPEEDALLCKARGIFGNRWTEIAKVVSGRTDNAVKNRFTTLCKRKARSESLAKENNFAFINSDNIRVMSSSNGGTDKVPDDKPVNKRARPQSRGQTETYDLEDRFHMAKKSMINQSSRSPLAVLAKNIDEQNSRKSEINEATDNGDANEIRGTYIGKDDPKIAALMKQAVLLSSLAMTVNVESTDQTLENAWMVLDDFLNQIKDGVLDNESTHAVCYKGEDPGDLVKELRRLDDKRPNQAYETVDFVQPELCNESSVSSECSKGLTAYPLPSDNQTARVDNWEQVPDSKNAELSSPLQVTPLFRSLAAGIPSPKFSQSERSFIMKMLGVESPSTTPSTNPPHNPACKRALLQQL
ncbi:hypothetical protein MLD38_024319 [Melastoma candidum]|uniref:Uncharacterized protein n=1 Tax=Melastoma candidum TaxID=119954 RepID=A0ACB9NSA7_9MYRT|nr:hypothetical protein MLD38_024319 [Melastoma candidum]